MAADKAPLVFQFQLLVYKISGVSMAQTPRFLVEHHELVFKIQQRTPTPLDNSAGSLRQEIVYWYFEGLWERNPQSNWEAEVSISTL